MPMTKAPTMLSLKGAADRPKTRPRPRRAETASPPKRSNTRKVNVVSQASLAMLNPAYAMGIEAGPSWQEEEETRWRRERAGHDFTDVDRPSFDRSSPLTRTHDPLPWSMDPTPELEAFLSTETMEYQLEPQEGGALGLVLQAPGMERKVSSESVFEDDEPLQVKRRPNAGPNSSTLSRFFTWKRSPRGKTIVTLAPSPWEVPQSAPPHIQTFDRPSLEIVARSSPSSSAPTFHGNSSPSSPTDVFGSTAISKTSTKTMSRKTSMPTLRDIRRAVGSPVGQDVSLPDVKPVDAATSFYWRTEMPRTPTMESNGTLTPSSSTSSTSTGGKSTPRSNSRVSSLGRGLASRKSTVEVRMMDESPPRVSKKKQQQPHQPQSSPRHDPWSMQNMPPLPTNISIASLIAAEEEEERRRSPSRSPAASSAAEQKSRRRSRSVGALPSFDSFTAAPLPSTPVIKYTDEAGIGSDAISTRIVRVSVANRSIIGTASPKLLVRDVHSPMSNSGSPRRKNALLQVTEPPVVVNVMPPTPDLGAVEQETFECTSSEPVVMSPGKHEPQEELASLVEGHSSPKQERKEAVEEDVPDAEEAVLAYTIGDRYDDEEESNDKYDNNDYDNDDRQSNGLSRSDSMRSDLSRSTSASAATDMTEGIDDPFGFARSMSTMSLSSVLSEESTVTVSEGENDDNDSDCCDAQIMSASSTVSSFSRAQLVSPRTREVSNWSNSMGSSSSSSQSLASSAGGISSLPSLASSLASSPSRSVQSSKRRSKRFSGLSSLAGQSLANVMIDDGTGVKLAMQQQNGTLSNLSSPVELQGQQVDEADCDTPRLSGGCNASTMASLVNTTKPLNVRKGSSSSDQTKTVAGPQTKQESPHHPNAVLSPPRPFPRAHNAESPHLELDLSLPLDLHDIGLGLEVEEVPQKRERPRLPQKSRARGINNRRSPASASGEPKTPPSTNRLLASVMQEDKDKESFGLGLGLGLDNAMELSTTDGKPISPTQAQIWQRPRSGFYAPQQQHSSNHHGNVGFAI